MIVYRYVYIYIYIYIYIHNRGPEAEHREGVPPPASSGHGPRDPDATLCYATLFAFCFLVGSETIANPYTSSFISLGLVYPIPQPLISNRPRQCRNTLCYATLYDGI